MSLFSKLFEGFVIGYVTPEQEKREQSERVYTRPQIDTTEAEFQYWYHSGEEICKDAETRGFLYMTEFNKLCSIIEILENRYNKSAYTYGFKVRLDRLPTEYQYKREHPNYTLV